MCPIFPARRYGLGVLLLGLLVAPGCHHLHRADHQIRHSPPHVPPAMPKELAKVVLPTYVIEPPDILSIDAVRVVPKPPYRIKSLDVLSIQVLGTLPDAPIFGPFTVEPGGIIHFGGPYGSVNIAGLTLEEATVKIRSHLRQTLADPQVSVTLVELATKQQIAGQHLVAPDGTVTLGIYGSVPVVGLSLSQAKAAIELHLAQFLEDPEVSVDVFAYNSKAYYIVTQGAGLGDNVVRIPVTGNETVLDAIAQINGLETVSSKKIWISRPTNTPDGCQILPVDWNAITVRGSGYTNYQILPGDRVFIAEDKLVAFDTHLGKIIAPIERVLGVTSLGAGTIRSVSNVNTNAGVGGF